MAKEASWVELPESCFLVPLILLRLKNPQPNNKQSSEKLDIIRLAEKKEEWR